MFLVKLITSFIYGLKVITLKGVSNIKKSLISREAEGDGTSNTDSPDSLLRAANSRIIVPAHAVQVSDSVPVRESGFRTPYRRFTWKKHKTCHFIQLKFYLVTY